LNEIYRQITRMRSAAKLFSGRVTRSPRRGVCGSTAIR
jgi:hypothetical protein